MHGDNFLRRRFPRRTLLKGGAAAAGLGAVGLLGCQSQSESKPAASTPAPAQPKRGGKVTLAQASDIFAGNMPFAFYGTNYPFYGAMWDTLVRYKLDVDELVAEPQLAESFEFSKDYSQLKLTLRQGVKFHSGRELTAQDIIWNLEKANADPTSQLRVPITRIIQKMEAPDARTVVLQLGKGALLLLDMFHTMRISDKESYEQLQKGSKFVGTGPFMFKEWVPGDHVTLVRNPDYWQKGLPYLDEVILKVIPDAQTQLINVQTGIIHAAYNVEPQNLATLKDDKKYTLYNPHGFSQVYQMSMNVSSAPFGDKRVRQAINRLVDRKRIAETMAYGFSMPIVLPWSPASPAYDAQANAAMDFNVEKARQLLAEAGFPNGFKTNFTISTAWPVWKSAAQVIQADAKKVGIDININVLQDADFISRFRAEGSPDMSAYNLANTDMHPAYPFLVTLWFRTKGAEGKFPTNSSQYETPEYQALIEKLMAATVDTELKSLYKQMNELLNDSSHAFSLMSRTIPVLLKKELHNFKIDRNGITYLTDAWLE